MDAISKSKWQVRGAAVIIFLLGFTAGALVLNAYRRWDRGSTMQSRQERFDRMLDTLKVSSDQKAQVHQILGDAREQLQALRKGAEPQVEEIRRQADERLQKVLTPEQWKQFQQERDKWRARGRRGKENSSTP
jgi:Spy/CpxP family protein refolding chaperone